MRVPRFRSVPALNLKLDQDGRALCGGVAIDARDTRFRPITLLEPIMKLVTGTVARRLSLLLHEQKLLHPHQFGFVKGGGCEPPIEIVNDMYQWWRNAIFGVLDCKRHLVLVRV